MMPSTGFVAGLLLLAALCPGDASKKTRPWRNVGDNSVLELWPGNRLDAQMVPFRDMLLLWGGSGGSINPNPDPYAP